MVFFIAHWLNYAEEISEAFLDIFRFSCEERQRTEKIEWYLTVSRI